MPNDAYFYKRFTTSRKSGKSSAKMQRTLTKRNKSRAWITLNISFDSPESAYSSVDNATS